MINNSGRTSLSSERAVKNDAYVDSGRDCCDDAHNYYDDYGGGDGESDYDEYNDAYGVAQRSYVTNFDKGSTIEMVWCLHLVFHHRRHRC